MIVSMIAQARPFQRPLAEVHVQVLLKELRQRRVRKIGAALGRHCHPRPQQHGRHYRQPLHLDAPGVSCHFNGEITACKRIPED
jgi:hypothetical protein